MTLVRLFLRQPFCLSFPLPHTIWQVSQAASAVLSWPPSLVWLLPRGTGFRLLPLGPKHPGPVRSPTRASVGCLRPAPPHKARSKSTSQALGLQCRGLGLLGEADRGLSKRGREEDDRGRSAQKIKR